MTRYRTAKLRRIADEDVEESALDRIIRERFDALLVRSEVDAANGFENQTLSLDLDRSIDILGPVTVEETYEIVDGKIEVG